MKRNVLRKNEGVTLIALVITIIILIILASVSITLIIKDNGILDIAKKAKEKTEIGQEKEAEELNQLSHQTEAILDEIPPNVPTVDLNGYENDKWTENDIEITFFSEDEQTGIKRYEYSNDGKTVKGEISSPWVINNDTEETIYIRAVDNEENKSDWTDAYTIKRHKHVDDCYKEQARFRNNCLSIF